MVTPFARVCQPFGPGLLAAVALVLVGVQLGQFGAPSAESFPAAARGRIQPTLRQGGGGLACDMALRCGVPDRPCVVTPGHGLYIFASDARNVRRESGQEGVRGRQVYMGLFVCVGVVYCAGTALSRTAAAHCQVTVLLIISGHVRGYVHCRCILVEFFCMEPAVSCYVATGFRRRRRFVCRPSCRGTVGRCVPCPEFSWKCPSQSPPRTRGSRVVGRVFAL